MIVTDANVGVYFATPVGLNFTQLARAAASRDPDWHVPVLWRTEVANALLVMRRRRHINDQLLLKAWAQVIKYLVIGVALKILLLLLLQPLRTLQAVPHLLLLRY